jgi:signal transduction histidine kinase
MQQSAADMVTKLSDIVWAVNPEHDSLHRLVVKLEEFLMDAASGRGIIPEVHFASSLDKVRLPMVNRRNIYLVGKEAINNAIKYSQATAVIFSVSVSGAFLVMSVSDDGVGFDPAEARRGNGLDNMQKRADEIGATLRIDSKINGGTTVQLSSRLP